MDENPCFLTDLDEIWHEGAYVYRMKHIQRTLKSVNIKGFILVVSTVDRYVLYFFQN